MLLLGFNEGIVSEFYTAHDYFGMINSLEKLDTGRIEFSSFLHFLELPVCKIHSANL